jgi:hypothetical protein
MFAPKLINEAVGRDHLVGMKHEDCQERALSKTA